MPPSEFLVIEIRIKPQPLIIYICYMSVFDLRIALTHYQRIKLITEQFYDHCIMVIGDFNLRDIVWSPDEEEKNVFLPHTLVDSNTSQNRSDYNVNALAFLNKMMSLPLAQLSNHRNRASNVLDLVFVNRPAEFRVNRDCNTIIDLTQQDPSHVPHETKLDYSVPTAAPIEYVTLYQYKRGHYDRMVNQLEAINFQHEFGVREIEAAHDFFCRYNEVVNRTKRTEDHSQKIS